MKINFNLLIKSQYLRNIDVLHAKISVKRGRPMTSFIVKMLPVIGIRVNLSRVKVIITFLSFCWQLQKRSGMKMLVIYLKAASVLLQQSIGGQRLHDMTPLGTRIKRTKSAGIPRLIPALDRKRIQKGEKSVIRFWLTLFNLYRILPVQGKVNLSSITDGSEMNPSFLSNWSLFCRDFYKKLEKFQWFQDTDLSWAREEPLEFLKELRAVPFIISKSSASAKGMPRSDTIPVSTSPAALIASCKVWNLPENRSLFLVLKDWAKMTGNQGVINRIESWSRFPTENLKVQLGTLGRLGFKEEAAGKVRVFAMVDAFTQWLMRPLWDRILQVLELIPQDGTRDQLKPVKALVKLCPRGPFFSFDLSSATDRLPVLLQIQLLAPVLGIHGARTWGTLLVGRSYHVSRHARTKYGLDQEYWYGSGQPMGALTSWGMLALTHHAIVQYAAVRAKAVLPGNWFSLYAVLGDDLVIAHKEVADAYLAICQEIGVKIGLHKSLVSPLGKAVEFAKRTFFKGEDVSPVPFTEMWVAHQLVSSGLEFARKYALSESDFLTLYGAGYKIKAKLLSEFKKLGRRWRELLLAYISPSGVKPRSWTDYLLSKSVRLRYGINPSRKTRLTNLLVNELFARIKQSLDSRQELWDLCKKLGEVRRDREYYGTTPVKGSRLRTFEDLTGVVGSTSQAILEEISNTVYRTAFLDVPIKVRDIRQKIEDYSGTEDELEEVLVMWESLSRDLSSLPLPSTLYYRSDKPDRIHFKRGSYIPLWDASSKILSNPRF